MGWLSCAESNKTYNLESYIQWKYPSKWRHTIFKGRICHKQASTTRNIKRSTSGWRKDDIGWKLESTYGNKDSIRNDQNEGLHCRENARFLTLC